MINKSQIQVVVFQAVDRLNEVVLDENTLSKDPDTVLLGEGAQLDSMGFVNFVVALEEVAAKEINQSINLAEALNVSGNAAPATMTIAGLVDFLFKLIQAASAEAK